MKIQATSKNLLDNVSVILDWCFAFMLAVGIGLCFNLPTVPNKQYQNFAVALVFIGFLNVVCRFIKLYSITKKE